MTLTLLFFVRYFLLFVELYCNKGFLRLDKDTPEPTPPLDRRLQATVAAAVAGEVAVVVAEMVAKVVVTAAKAVAGGGEGNVLLLLVVCEAPRAGP